MNNKQSPDSSFIFKIPKSDNSIFKMTSDNSPISNMDFDSSHRETLKTLNK